MSEDKDNTQGFSALGLSERLVKTLDGIGYETPSPIQVAEAFQKYAAKLEGFHVIPIYGGQDFRVQLRQLKHGVHVIVGTPGRVMDHIRRETIDLQSLSCVVLDEADEMLRMGFIDDVDWIMERTPAGRQVALFSATVPEPIKRIAQRHLVDPVEIEIKAKTTTADTIRQRYWMVSGLHKLDALTRVLEGEEFDAMIVFTRTKTATMELADRLQARGFAAAALNGDIAQAKRERTIDRLKSGTLDILVATDVAARGLDVDRVSHVLNYDIPYDNESYVHRIGRTGRAGRLGEAILFVAPREKRLLRSIERATNQKIELMDMPTTQKINDKRIEKFKTRISEALDQNGLDFSRILSNSTGRRKTYHLWKSPPPSLGSPKVTSRLCWWSERRNLEKIGNAVLKASGLGGK